MAIQLKNCVFVHIPKTGGRWITAQIQNHVQGYSYIGDPIYDAHKSPDTNLPVFAFVRHPITMLNSLWQHRSRKHTNKRHKPWNWQQDIRLERECGCEDYVEFFRRVAERPGIVDDYYRFFIGKYKQLQIGRMENIAEDLIRILRHYGETFDKQKIMANGPQKIGNASKGLYIKEHLDIVVAIMENEKEFCELFNYKME